MIAHLESELPGLYTFELADRVGEGAVLSGSMDILDGISRGPSDSADASFFGCAQSDVAYYFQAGGHRLYPTAHHRRGEVVALARAYREILHLYSNGPGASNGSGAFGSFDSALADWDEIYVGALGSGTLITALNLLSMYQLDSAGLGTPRILQQHLSDGFERAPPKGPWGGLLVAGTGDPAVESRIASGAGQLLSLTPGQRRHLVNAYSQFYSTAKIDGYGQRELSVLEVPALLVASKRLPGDVVESLVGLLDRLDDPVFGGEALYSRLLDAVEKKMTEPLPVALPGEVLAGIERYRGQRAEGLVLSPHRAILGLREDWGRWELAIFLAAAALAFFVFRRLVRDLRKKGSLLELSSLMTGLGAVALSIGWIHLCLFVVSRLEYRCFMRYDTDVASPFIRYSYPDLLPMVLQYLASAFSSENLFPLDHTGQLVWLSIPVLIGISGLAGIVHMGLPPILNYIRDNLEKGADMELENHFIIVNWHPHAQDVIGQLRVQEQMAKGKDPRVVVLARTAEDVSLPHLGRRKGKNVGEHSLYALPSQDAEDEGVLTVVGLEGDPEKCASLRMVCPKKAEAVIVFPDPAHAEPDSATVLTVLRLQDILGESSEVRLLVWCADAANVALFQDPRFRLTDACSTEWAWRVLCQATRVGHVSTIYRHLLTSSEDSNEFYEYSLPKEWKGNFAQAQEAIRKHNEDSTKNTTFGERRNTILLVGYFEATDCRRERVHMNPAPDSNLLPGDALVFLTYVYDRAVKAKLDNLFVAAAEEA